MAWRDNASFGNVTVEKRLKIEGSVEGWSSGYLGNHYYVDGNIGTNGVGRGGSWSSPVATIDYAVGLCTANNGDVIHVAEGHNESVIAAGGLDLDVAGITIIFYGSGTDRAKITFGTAVTADMDVDAANITLVNPKFVAGIDSLAGPIDVNSTDFNMVNAEYHDATDIETLDAVILEAEATCSKIDGYKYFCGIETADLKQSHIQLNGCDDIELKNIDIRGNFFAGNIENVTDEVLNARLENMYLENLNATPKPAMVLDADATGSCKNVKLKIASGTTYVSNVGKMSWDDRCEGFMGDGYAGETLGTVLGTGLEGKIDVVDGYFDVPTADAVTDATIRDVVGRKTDAAVNAVATTKSQMAYLKGIVNEITVPAADNTANGFMNDVIGQKADAAAAGAVTATDTLVAYIKQLVNQANRTTAAKNVASITTANLFTVATGPIRLLAIAGHITTVIQAAANATKLVHTSTGGAAIDLCATLDVTGSAVRKLLTITGTKANAMALSADEGVIVGNLATPLILTPGILSLNCAATTTGVIDWYVLYEPLAPGANMS